jgi:protein-tyrosine phosphatase
MNFRDLGGYPTRDGKALAWGRLYRGGALACTDPAVAAQTLRQIGLKRVIDLRAGDEVPGLNGDGWPASCQRLHVPLYRAIRPQWANPTDRTPLGVARRYMEILEEGLPSVLRIIDALRDVASTPTLIHCAVGRDRTGLVVACLLDLAGVDDEVIGDDYALSDAAVQDGEPAHPDTMPLFLGLIRNTYGSTRDMLVGHGASPRAVEEVSAALLA